MTSPSVGRQAAWMLLAAGMGAVTLLGIHLAVHQAWEPKEWLAVSVISGCAGGVLVALGCLWREPQPRRHVGAWFPPTDPQEAFDPTVRAAMMTLD